MSQAATEERAADRLRGLPGLLRQQAGFQAVADILAGGGLATIERAWGSVCALAAATLAECGGPLVVVAPHQDAADELADDLPLFASAPLARFPAVEDHTQQGLLTDDAWGWRQRTLERLRPGRDAPPLIVTSIQALLQPTPAPEDFDRHSLRFQVGDRLDMTELSRWLVERGFHHTSGVELPGEFSARGGILDVFPLGAERPLRLELFDDELESIRHFDPISQRSQQQVTSAELALLPLGASRGGHFCDFLSRSARVLLTDLAEIEQQGGHFLKRTDDDDSVHGLAATLGRLKDFGTAIVAPLGAGGGGENWSLGAESVERFQGDIVRVRQQLEQTAADADVILVCPTDAEIQRLEEIFSESPLARQDRLHFLVGGLSSGFRLPEQQMLLLSSADLFHRSAVRRVSQRKLGRAIDSFMDLREGDLVVHLGHGIGRYRGMKLLEKGLQVEEHLEIEFHGGSRIYVPAAKIDLVQKYVGGGKARPGLARIGGKTWARQKKAVEAAVTDVAAELLDLQAERSLRPGISLSFDTTWQQEFDAAFPYQETPDQLRAAVAIKDDLESSTPMDRLLCGDVGFGKTEIAMRAAFKAVDNGYQVAVLAPTTVLVEQHFRTFTERMAEFPFEIAKLSRFCTAREQRETVSRLKQGAVDIVVGTHRLASRDVAFQNLGLVIIDEEQRFGVEVKERLKSLRATVNVLTMTATPIPRTLHMSLSGLRDISNLETAPEERLAVETRLTRWSNEIIRRAVLRELNRGGQIYFVHNRIGDIQIIATRLKQIVPEARLRIGHGQMAEGELERVMVDFVDHRFDLLLATTIVESGLDIPRANTIFIDEADRYGLAELHQLRGRVGRYKHRAHCYLLIDPNKRITPVAAKRLRAIEEFSELGAGFALAMRDLEIRGAGNILGPQQSGHIAHVGYELYCQLLERAVRRLQKLPPKLKIEVDLDLPCAAYLPADYIADMRAKIDLYRRLTRIAGDEELAELRRELVDRFGPPPAEVETALELAELKIDAAVWQIDSIYVEGDYLVFTSANAARLKQLATAAGGRLRLADDRSGYLPLDRDRSGAAILAAAKSVLRPPAGGD